MTTYGTLRDGIGVGHKLRRFAARVADESPLYSAICSELADDAAVAAILADVPITQPAPNILLASVQFLLLDGGGPELAAHYPSLRTPGMSATGYPIELFRTFCLDHADRLAEIAAAHKVQTNEVRRCAGLLAAFSLIAAEAEQPLALIEIGASAGLNLRFDAYRYNYSGTLLSGPTDAAVEIRTESRGVRPPVGSSAPEVASRIGVDLDPVVLDDRDAVRWVRALLWPEQLDRIALFESAVADAAHDPPTVLEGNGIDMIETLASQAPVDARLCVFHTYTFNQVPPADQDRFVEALRRIAAVREVDRISIEFDRNGPHPTIAHERYANGTATSRTLAEVHHHGAWLDWQGA